MKLNIRIENNQVLYLEDDLDQLMGFAPSVSPYKYVTMCKYMSILMDYIDLIDNDKLKLLLEDLCNIEEIICANMHIDPIGFDTETNKFMRHNVRHVESSDILDLL